MKQFVKALDRSVCLLGSNLALYCDKIGKHSSSTTMRHRLDFEILLNLKEFEDITRSGINRAVSFEMYTWFLCGCCLGDFLAL